MSVAALNFKSYTKGAMRGFLDLRYHGLTIKGCRLMDGKNGLWVALPQQKGEHDGETKWFDQIYLSPPEADHVRRLVLADLKAQGHLPYDKKQASYGKKRPPNGQKGGRSYQKYTNEDLSDHFPDAGGEEELPF